MTEDETYEYDIAVSFAGEDRELVREVVDGLKEHDVEVFFDEDRTAEMWGENLVDFLQAIYSRRARYAVLFISRHYVAKKWTTYERKAAQDRAFQQSASYILPVRIDDSELPGLLSTVGYLDAGFAGAQGIVDAILRKLGNHAHTRAPKFDGRAPRTPEAIAVVLSERPPGWEFLLYGGLLHQGIAELEDKFRDHVIEFAPHNGRVVADDEGLSWLANKLTSINAIVSNLERVWSDEARPPPSECLVNLEIPSGSSILRRDLPVSTAKYSTGRRRFARPDSTTKRTNTSPTSKHDSPTSRSGKFARSPKSTYRKSTGYPRASSPARTSTSPSA